MYIYIYTPLKLTPPDFLYFIPLPSLLENLIQYYFDLLTERCFLLHCVLFFSL